MRWRANTSKVPMFVGVKPCKSRHVCVFVVSLFSFDVISTDWRDVKLRLHPTRSDKSPSFPSSNQPPAIYDKETNRCATPTHFIGCKLSLEFTFVFLKKKYCRSQTDTNASVKIPLCSSRLVLFLRFNCKIKSLHPTLSSKYMTNITEYSHIRLDGFTRVALSTFAARLERWKPGSPLPLPLPPISLWDYIDFKLLVCFFQRWSFGGGGVGGGD